ncbi:DUF4974 domain-containing protein [Mucilaginibacter puniceus]
MDKEELKTLFTKYNDGTATENERAVLEAWYLQHNESVKPGLSSHHIEAAKNELFRRLPGNQGEFFKIGARMAAAAVIIGILISVTLLYVVSRQPAKPVQIAHDLPPGSNKATLTLASGKQINLTDAHNGLLLKQAGIQVTKNGSGRISFRFPNTSGKDHSQNTVSTPKGGQWEVRLGDGSQVWLNAASSITFPTSFANSENRIVTLTGEAYFEVAKDKAHPFIVISGQQRVEVLGTHFNINSYEDEPNIVTTLLEGSVKVSQLGKKNTHILFPGQQSLASAAGINIKTVDTDEAVAWKEGYFQFDDEPINSVMRKLSRWYDVDVRYSDTVSTEGIYGRVSRNKNISQVIKALEATKTVHFRLEGRRVSVMK